MGGDGTTCEVDPCATENGGCAPGATCTNDGGKAVCACPEGFLGNGKVCEEDACATNNGNCGAFATCESEGGVAICTEIIEDCPEFGLVTKKCKCNGATVCDPDTVYKYCHSDGSCNGKPEEDPCDKCDENAQCIKKKKKGKKKKQIVCKCLFGFKGDGETCEKVTEVPCAK